MASMNYFLNIFQIGHTILTPSQLIIALTPYWLMFSGDVANTNLIVFNLTGDLVLDNPCTLEVSI